MKLTIASVVSLAALLQPIAAGPVKLVERQSFPVNNMIDDADGQVKYSGNWVHLTNQGSNYKDGTESYTGDADG